MKKYIELADGTKSYQMDNGQFVVATGDPVGIQWLLPKTLDALGVEIHEEVEVPTGVGAVVQGVGIRIGAEGASPAGFETKYVKLGDLHNGWVSLEARFYKDSEVQWVLANGGKVLSEGVEV